MPLLFEQADHIDNSQKNQQYLELFLAAKKLEGCSQRTLDYYRQILRNLMKEWTGSILDISAEELRLYLQNYQKTHDVGKVSIDNMRRIISSFFSWLETEDYIMKSPARKLRKVKPDKIIKTPFIVNLLSHEYFGECHLPVNT